MIFLAELKMMEIKFLLLAQCPVSGSGAMENACPIDEQNFFQLMNYSAAQIEKKYDEAPNYTLKRL